MQNIPALPALPHRETCRLSFRQYDRERYLLSLFQPSPLREMLWVLGAFNVELARTADSVSEAMIGAIRLKWWDEVLDEIESGQMPRKHPVAESLHALHGAYRFSLTPLRQVINARIEYDLAHEGEEVVLADVAALDGYALATGAGMWMPLASLVAEEEKPAVESYLRSAGQCWALLGLLRATGYHLSQGRCYIPESVLREHGLTKLMLSQPESLPKLLHIIEALAIRLEENLDFIRKTGKNLPQPIKSFSALNVLLKHYLNTILRNPYNVLGLGERVQPIEIIIKIMLAKLWPTR